MHLPPVACAGVFARVAGEARGKHLREKADALRVGDRVSVKPGSAAADVAGDGSLLGTVQSVETAPADGVPQVVVLMDDGLTVQSLASDWTVMPG